MQLEALSSKAKRGDDTRLRILDTAMDLFRERGFAKTTMREIAAEAKVALGAAYYYFESKDAIVLAFYDRAQQEMEPLVQQALETTQNLPERLRALLRVKLEYFAPNRRLLSALSGHTDPENPMSPFSAETRAIREKDVGYFDQAISGSNVKVPADLRPYLPQVLWFYQMGLILFWINDQSEEQWRTEFLVTKSVPIVANLIQLAGLPLLKSLRRNAVELLEGVVSIER